MSRGHIRKRKAADGTIRYQLIVELPTTDGKRRQRVETQPPGTKKREAEDRLNVLLLEQGEGPLVKGSNVGRLWDEYAAAAGHAVTSAAEVKRARARLPETFLAMPVAKVTGRDVARVYADLERAGTSPHQLRQLHIYLRAAFNRGVQWGMLTRNPCTAVAPKRPPKKKPNAPEPGDVAALLGAATVDLRAALLVAATTGMRRGEVVALRWEDVNLLAGVAHVHRAIAYAPGSGVVEKETKTERERTVPLAASVVAALVAHYQDCARVGTPAGYVFSKRGDGRSPWRPDYLTHRFADLRKTVGVPVVMKNLRHFAATSMLAGGADVRTVAEILGHSQVSTTHEFYAAFLPVAGRAAVEGVEHRLSGLGDGATC